jgi:mono/diheme cytochrome c family protein
MATVIIGNGGSEYITRGYVTGYDAETGKQVWRFYTVPGEPGKPDGAASDQVLERKAPPDTANAAVVAQGKLHYHTYCSMCHGDSGVSGGVLPDLRYSAALGNASAWQSIVRDGVRQANGMVSFGKQMNKDEIETIRAYVVHRANEQVAGDRKQAK